MASHDVPVDDVMPEATEEQRHNDLSRLSRLGSDADDAGLARPWMVEANLRGGPKAVGLRDRKPRSFFDIHDIERSRHEGPREGPYSSYTSRSEPNRDSVTTADVRFVKPSNDPQTLPVTAKAMAMTRLKFVDWRRRSTLGSRRQILSYSLPMF